MMRQPFKGVALSAPELRMIADALARAGQHISPYEDACANCGEYAGGHDNDCPAPKVRKAYDFVVGKLKALDGEPSTKGAGVKRD